MSKRNSHQLLYRGPAQGIPTQTMRAKLADILSAYAEPIVLTVGFIVVLVDLFVWRILP